MDKDNIRKELLAKRNSLSENEIEEKSGGIRHNIENCTPFKNASKVMLYFEIGSEVKVSPLLMDSKEFYLPKIFDESIIAVKFDGFENLKINKFGIKEPSGNENEKGIDLCIVPGVGFDKNSVRIGYGKGYYDKFLSEFKGLKIGVCYDFQMVEDIPSDSHDIKMDVIITEKDVHDNRR